ncbi:MAG: FtsX-like permease family protein [Rhodobacterales bacterium]|nr:FtsX-like permease family protein [Rhodobacterales bacterium]
MKTRPFAAFEWMIAWRYVRALRAEGGVSVLTWISFLGVTLAVFALVATLAVRSGFRAELVGTILGSNAHATIYRPGGTIEDFDAMAERLRAVPGVTSVAPLIRGQSMASANGRDALADIYGIRMEDLAALDGIANPEMAQGQLADVADGIALGAILARDLGMFPGARIEITIRAGARTPMGRATRVNAFDVGYVFSTGRFDMDKTRAYLPFETAQLIFNRDGVADELDLRLADPDNVAALAPALAAAAGPGVAVWTWQDASGGYLRALTVEDNVMFVILSILVLLASLTIISGLIMLVKNKGRDIGILRTMGLTEGSILRIFFLCGAGIGTAGTIAGVILGSLFAIYIDPIFAAVNYVAGGGVWDPSIRGLYTLPAELHLRDVIKAVSLSLFLSWVVTIFPARRAARMNPVEALRYE